MAYTDDAVKAKLSALTDTQEGITGVAQWIMFHRRHADRTAQLWLQRVKDSAMAKRLNLIYLANEVAQQSKMRKKLEFISAFSPIIAEGAITAYRSATQDVQQKIRRVIEVWRTRATFDQAVQEAIEKGVDEIDKNRGGVGGVKKAGLGGTLFSSGPAAPQELQPLVPLQQTTLKAQVAFQSALDKANNEYDKATNPSTAIPTPPVHAHQLGNLLRTLANAEGAVTESIKCRRALIEGLEKLLNTNRTALNAEETHRYELSSKKTSIEAKKREVEDKIMRGLSAEGSGNGEVTYEEEAGRPDVEQLTPPPMESLTPTGSPPAFTTTTGADITEEYPPTHADPVPFAGMSNSEDSFPGLTSSGSTPGYDSLAHSLKRGASEDGSNGMVFKRRSLSNTKRVDAAAEFEGDVALDADVTEMLG